MGALVQRLRNAPNTKALLRRGFFVAGVGQSVGQNDLIKTDLIRFGLKGIQQPHQNGMGTKVGTYFTRQGSLVQIQPRPPFYSLYYCSLA